MPQGSTRFRSSWTHREGAVPAEVVQGTIFNVNFVNWTVDVVSQFDQKHYFDIQVGSPYVHPNNGEGLSIFPEVGAKCMVTLPSDSSPPYVSCFLMPVEVTDLASEDAPAGTTSNASPGASSSGASFAGGRPIPKPGDMYLRTRDDNFVILHRGGVLQLGANELSQRLYIPMQSQIMDVSQNYAHHNAGGSIQWLIGEGPDGALPTQYGHTFRVQANSEFADVRVRCGKVSAMQEPPGELGNQTEIDAEGLGAGDDVILYEVVVAKDGFNPVTGDLATGSVRDQSVFRFFFDRAGGTFLRCKGSMILSTKKRLTVRALEGIDIETGGQLTARADGMVIDGGSFVDIKGGSVRVNGGTQPVAHLGAPVQVILPYTPLPTPGPPVPLLLTGFVKGGRPGCLV